ncbi:hypothetical protein [Deinococcus aquatilis]|uniref:hypothetical protein n=1 Tax=Deinococcus aquatilis TaxID=519440 RepID=UPI0012F717EA|nr:hypothetical protein [Deinococcus aquatilis]
MSTTASAPALSPLLNVLRHFPHAIVLVGSAGALEVRAAALPHAQLHVVPDVETLTERLTQLNDDNLLHHVLLDPEVSVLWSTAAGLPAPWLSFRTA